MSRAAGGLLLVALALPLPATAVPAPGEPVRRAAHARPADARGDTLPRVIPLPAVEVVAQAAAAVASTPGSVGVVEARRLERARALSTSEVLRRIPGIHVAEGEDAFGLNLNIGVRGLNPRRSARVLLMENGAPIHLAPYGDPSAHYQPPAWSLERVEVLKGSGQILHGPQTVGGVVNFVRAEPDGRGSLFLSGGDGGLFAVHARAGRGGERGHAGVEYVHRQGDGPRRGWGHRIDDVSLRLLARPGRSHSLSLRAGAYREDSALGQSGLTLAEFRADPRSNPFPNDAFQLERHALQLLHDVDLGWGSLVTNVYGQRIHRVSWRQASNSADRFGTERYAARFDCPAGASGPSDCGNQGRPRTYRFGGVEPRLRVAGSALGLAARLDAGVRVHRETAERRQRLGATPTARTGELVQDNELSTSALAAFVQSRFFAGDWSVTPGVRLERVAATNRNRMTGDRLEDDYARWLPGLGVAFNGLAGVTLFAGTHRGFAPPRPADILDPVAGQGLVQVEPEVSWNHEVGLRGRFGEALSLEATVFRIDFENQIVAGDLVGSGQRLVNAGETLHEGVELALSLRATGVEVDLAHTHLARARFRSEQRSSVDGETPVRGNRLPYAPRRMTSVGVGLRLPPAVSLHLHGDRTGAQFSDDLNTVGSTEDGMRGVIPAHTVYTLNLERAFRDSALTLFLTAKNLLNTLYISDRTHGIMVGMPRTVSGGIGLTLP